MGFFDKMTSWAKAAMGFSEDYESDEIGAEAEDVVEPRFESRSTQKRNNIIPIGKNNASHERIGVVQIKSFSETQIITSELKARRPVVFSVDGLDYNEARRVVDYVSGTIYGIDGHIKKAMEKSSIFIATPSHILIEPVEKRSESVRDVVSDDLAL